MTEKYTYREIWDDKDGGYLTMPSEELRDPVVRALLKVPKEVVDRVAEECLFIMPSPGIKGFFIPKRLLEGRDVILLSEKLLEEDDKEKFLTILHEVGHFYLNHKSPIFDGLSVEEDRKQEEEAERWASQWIEDITMKIVDSYLNVLVHEIKVKISEEINNETIKHILAGNLAFHINNKASAKFHEFYYTILSNRQHILETEGFFKEFKKQYKLQGIDGQFLETIEKDKQQIISMIDSVDFANLYAKYFRKAIIQQKGMKITKDLCSFFSKLVHTFKPDDYCALDNPIKEYLGLKKEGFFIAFCAISRAYREWAQENKTLLLRIRKRLNEIDKENKLQQNRMSDLKLLDLIFWPIANKKLGHLQKK